MRGARGLRASVLSWSVLMPLLLLNLFPFAVMLATALTPAEDLMRAGSSWIPRRPTLENFPAMWRASGVGPALTRSLIVASVSSIVATGVAAPAAYALSRFPFRLLRPYEVFLLITQMVPPIMLLGGLFRLMVQLGAVDSLAALAVVYAAFQVGFSVWMLRNAFDAIPFELEEAARLDGASRLKTLWFIVLPLSVPALCVVVLFNFIASWNDFAIALALLRSPGSLTLPVQVQALVAGRYEVEWEQVMAAVLVATGPVAILFSVLQRHLGAGFQSSPH
ncbi:MAG: carbohydrate ABC transporter permease [Janthinobacterium lividum]